MINRLLYWLTGRLPVRLIHNGDRPYLERYYVGQILSVTVYLHRFVNCDGDRDVHDHPWTWSIGMPLAGRYHEQRLRYLDPDQGMVCDLRIVRRFMPNIIRAHTFHRIAWIRRGTWTLFMHGRRVKGWGFLDREHDGVESSVRYHQPLDVSGGSPWWQWAPVGRESDRESLEVSA